MSKTTVRRLVGKPRTVDESSSIDYWSYSDRTSYDYSEPTLEFRGGTVSSYDVGEENDCLPLPTDYDPDGWLLEPLPEPGTIPVNDRASTGRSVITLEQGGFYDFMDIQGDFVTADDMPEESTFISGQEWICSYYVANESGYHIAERYRSSSFQFFEGGSLRYNGIDTSWTLNSTELTMGNLFFDIVEFRSFPNDELTFWETPYRYFRCLSSSS